MLSGDITASSKTQVLLIIFNFFSILHVERKNSFQLCLFHFVFTVLQLVCQDPQRTVDMKQPFNSTIVEVCMLFLRFGKNANLVV